MRRKTKLTAPTHKKAARRRKRTAQISDLGTSMDVSGPALCLCSNEDISKHEHLGENIEEPSQTSNTKFTSSDFLESKPEDQSGILSEGHQTHSGHTCEEIPVHKHSEAESAYFMGGKSETCWEEEPIATAQNSVNKVSVEVNSGNNVVFFFSTNN